MTAKNRITLGAITAVVMVICMLLAYRVSDRLSQTKTQTPNELAGTDPRIAPSPVTKTDSIPKKNAARSIRAPMELSSATSRKQLEMTHDAPKKAAENSRSSSSTAPAGAVPVKTPGELIARFTVDDPTQVFQPESVRYHEAVAAEPIDPNWGPIAESQLGTFLRDQLTPNYEFISTDCRTDLCELNLVGPSTGSSDAFSAALKQMEKQPWWEALEFDQESGVVTFDGNQMVVVYFFSRK